jgi:kumamolisin
MGVVLNPQSQPALDGFLQDLYDPHSSNFRHFLNPSQFTTTFYNATVRSQVISFLNSQGLHVSDSGLGAIVGFSGTVAQVESAFNLQINDYQAANGRIFYANDVTPALPTALAPNIQTIVGLDNRDYWQPQLVKPTIVPRPKANAGTPSGCTAAVSISSQYGSYTPNQFATAYNFTPLYTSGNQGQGQTVALFELSDYSDANVTAYQTCFGTSVPVSRVPVAGGAALDPQGESEVELDIEVVAGMAPQINNLLVYEAPNGSGIIPEYQQIANDNTAQIVSTSWGSCETINSSNIRDTLNAIYQQMAAQGQSIFAAAGDSGAQDCSSGIGVDDPASEPFVTGVGGTALTVNADNSYHLETVWNEYNNQKQGAGGGGISTIWAKPSYQTGAGTLNSYSNGKRQVPDVSADGDSSTGYTVYVHDETNCPVLNGTNDCFMPVGGTSAAAPMWAAGTALVNRYLSTHGGGQLGFANPTIYTLLKLAPSSYHDVKVGDNCYAANCAGGAGSGLGTYPATVGYDQASGVGSFDVTTFAAKALAPASYVYNLPFLANNAYNFTSFLAFQNNSNVTANISIQYFGSNGLNIASDISCPTLAAHAECIAANPLATGTSGQGIIYSDQPLNAIVAEATPFGGGAYAVSSGASSNLIEPLAFNGYLGGFNTLFFVFNAGASATTATISYYAQDGIPIPAATTTFNIGAQAGVSLNQADANSGLPVGFDGYAQISGGTGSQLTAQVLEYNTGIGFVAIANAQSQINAQTTLYAPGIFKNAFGFNTGANIINPNNVPVTVNLTYYDGATGTPTATAPFQLAPHAIQGVFQGGSSGNGLPVGGLPATFSGSASITTQGGGVFMVVNELGSSGAQSGVYAAAASGASMVGLPVMANNGFGYTTGTTILNTSNAAISGKLTYYTTAGQVLGTAQTFTIPAHASQLYYQGSLSTTFYGTAVVTLTTGAANSLIVTTNAQSSSIFYTYTEPSQ